MSRGGPIQARVRATSVDHPTGVQFPENPPDHEDPGPRAQHHRVAVIVNPVAAREAGRHEAGGRLPRAVRESPLDSLTGWWIQPRQQAVQASRPQWLCVLVRPRTKPPGVLDAVTEQGQRKPVRVALTELQSVMHERSRQIQPQRESEHDGWHRRPGWPEPVKRELVGQRSTPSATATSHAMAVTAAIRTAGSGEIRR